MELVFREGEKIGAYNGNLGGSGGITVDIFLSGYLVKASGFGDNR